MDKKTLRHFSKYILQNIIYFHRIKKVIRVWNDMFHYFWVNNPFKLPNIMQVMLMCVTLSVGMCVFW